MPSSTHTMIVAALLCLSPLALAFSGKAHADVASKSACFRSCVSCESRCKHDRVCIQSCLQLKRACCESGGNGPGPSSTCSCT